jgi:dolichyl-phosphate beta-glucosyltransferase
VGSDRRSRRSSALAGAEAYVTNDAASGQRQDVHVWTIGDRAEPLVTIVVPACEDQDRLQRTMKRLATHVARTGWCTELLVVDDANEGELKRMLAPWIEHFERLRMVRHHTKRGPGAAMRSGALLASGQYVITAEVDLAAPIEDSKTLIESLAAGADVAIASREVGGAHVRAPRPPMRRAFEACFSLAARALVSLSVRDLFCGQMGFRRAAARAIAERAKNERTTWPVEWVALAERLGLQVIECPVRFAHTVTSKDLFGLADFARVQDLVRLRNDLALESQPPVLPAQQLMHETSFVQLDRTALFGSGPASGPH